MCVRACVCVYICVCPCVCVFERINLFSTLLQHTQLSTFVSDVNNNIEVDISIMPIEEGIHIVNRRVTVVLINRSDKAISWNVDCHGLGKNSMLAIVVSQAIVLVLTSYICVFQEYAAQPFYLPPAV